MPPLQAVEMIDPLTQREVSPIIYRSYPSLSLSRKGFLVLCSSPKNIKCSRLRRIGVNSFTSHWYRREIPLVITFIQLKKSHALPEDLKDNTQYGLSVLPLISNGWNSLTTVSVDACFSGSRSYFFRDRAIYPLSRLGLIDPCSRADIILGQLQHCLDQLSQDKSSQRTFEVGEEQRIIWINVTRENALFHPGVFYVMWRLVILSNVSSLPPNHGTVVFTLANGGMRILNCPLLAAKDDMEPSMSADSFSWEHHCRRDAFVDSKRSQEKLRNQSHATRSCNIEQFLQGLGLDPLRRQFPFKHPPRHPHSIGPAVAML
ncbi:hypothetical protein VNO77_44172 [Canavalia gladiata]|uniref:Uncharacterized protein n=1 Tax=Canavalia gladiata TaxID=3824 RepID=A0AAN9PQ46_CANGL